MAHAPKTRSEKAVLSARRAWCYLVLVLISFLCLFFFYILIVNSTRTHFEIQKGFSLLPGKSMLTNFKNVLADANIPVGSGIRNSLIVSACSAALSVYFSALTAYGIYAYNFRFKKAAFAIILLIMTMPTQVSALGFLQLITKMGLKNSFIPLIRPILVYVMITSMIGGLQMFDVPQILTNGKGGPDRTSTTMIMYLNNHLFSKNYGMAGAVSVVLFLVCAVLCVVVYFSLTKEDDGLTKAQHNELKAAKKVAAKAAKGGK